MTAAIDENGKKLALISYFTDDDSAVDVTFTFEVKGAENAEICLLDDSHDLARVARLCSDGRFTLTMKPNTVIRAEFN